MFWIKLTVSSLLISLSSLAWAEGADGIFVAVDMGRSTFKNACNSNPPGFTECNDHDQSHRVALGMSVTGTMSGEIGYYSSGQTIKKNPLTNQSNAIDSVEWQLIGTRSFPIGEGRFAFMARMGLVRWIATEASTSGHSRISRAGNSILVGAGAKYFLTGSTILRALYEVHPAGDSSVSGSKDIRFLSLGAYYFF